MTQDFFFLPWSLHLIVVIYAFSYRTGFVLAYFSNTYFNNFFLNLSFTFSFKVVVFQSNVVFCFILYLMKVKVTQSCPTLCYPMDYTVHGILQARILEWVAISFSSASSHPRDRTQVSPALQADLYQLSYQGSLGNIINFHCTYLPTFSLVMRI